MKKIVLIIVGVVIICFSFLISNFNFSSVDILMRPPKLSGENSLLQQTFEATVGGSENIVMKTPVSGENRSSYLIQDLDNDSVSEALVLYSNPAKDALVYVSIFKFIDENWSLVSKIEGISEEVYSIDFADLNGDNIYEILISWSSIISNNSLSTADLGGNGDKVLSIYSYGEESTNLVKNETYTNLLIEDINNDYNDELFIINISLSNQEKITSGRFVSFNDDYSIDHDLKFNITGMLDVQNIACDTYSLNGENHTRVYVDGLISENGIITEIVDIKHNDFEVTLPLYESNISGQSETLRDVRIYSQDFDNDGIVEVPTIEKLPGGMKISSTSNKKSDLNLTVWSEMNGGLLEEEIKCLWNGTHGYMFEYPQEWIGMYTSIYDESSATISFYSLDEHEKPTNILFSIKTIFEPEWKENSNEYVKIDENGVYIYGYSIIDKKNNALYVNVIENNFALIN